MPDGQIKQYEIISKEAIQDPVTLNNNLKQVLTTIEEITQRVTSLNGSLKSITGFSELSKTQSESQIATKNLTEAQKEAVKINTQLEKSIAQLSNSHDNLLKRKQSHANENKLLTRENIAQEGSIKKLRATIANLTNQYESLNLKTTQGQQKAKQLTQEILKQEQSLKKYDAAIGKHQRNVGNYTGALGGLARQVKSLALTYISLYGAWNLVKSIFTTTKELDSVSLTFKTIIKDSTELAGAQAFLSDITAKYGLDLLEVSKAYIKFRASAEISGLSVKKTNAIFESFSKVGSVMGKSSEDLTLIFLALEQMLNKNRVSAEELRRQLGEKVPAAVAILAKSMGVTTEELDKMMKAGTVISKDVLPNFAKVMEETLGITSIEYVDTLTAAQNRLKTAWIELVDSMGQSRSIFMRGLNDAAALLNKLMPFYQKQKRINIEVNDQLNNYKDTLQNVIEKEGEQAAKNKLAEYLETVKNNTLNLREEIDKLQKSKWWVMFTDGALGVKKLKEEQKLLFHQMHVNRNLWQELLYTDVSKLGPVGGEIKQPGYLETLRKELTDYQTDLEKLPKILGKENEYWEERNDILSKIKQKQEEINRILGKGKEKETTGLINLLEEEITEKEKLIKLAKSKDEIDKLTEELKLRKDLLEILKITNDLKLLEPKGIEPSKEEKLPTAFQMSDKDIEKNIRLFELTAKYGFQKNEEFANSINELNELLDNDIITKTQYFGSVATLWMDNNKEIIDSVYTMADEILNAWAKINDGMIKDAEDRVRKYDDLIKDTERQLKEEEKNQEEGKNNNVAIYKSRLEEENKLRNKAIKDLEKAQKQQAAIELVEQAVSITTAVASAIKGFSKIPIVGVVLGLAAAAAIIGAFVSYKQQIKSATNQKYAEGEIDIQGDAKPHSQGGKVVEIERHESIIAAKATQESKGLLTMINEGKITDKDLGLDKGINLTDKLKMSFLGNVPIIRVDKTNTSIIERELYELRKSQNKLLDFFENRDTKELIDPTTGKVYRKKGYLTQEFKNVKQAYGF